MSGAVSTGRKRGAALAALLGLAVQVLVAVPHIHQPPPTNSFHLSEPVLALTAPASNPTDEPVTPLAPSPCLVCLAISLACSAVAAAPPATAPPMAVAEFSAAIWADRAVRAQSTSPFGARAPPPSIA